MLQLLYNTFLAQSFDPQVFVFAFFSLLTFLSYESHLSKFHLHNFFCNLNDYIIGVKPQTQGYLLPHQCKKKLHCVAAWAALVWQLVHYLLQHSAATSELAAVTQSATQRTNCIKPYLNLPREPNARI